MEYGVLSLVPPVLAIALAIITKDIIVSLLVSSLVSITIVCNWNPILGFTTMIKEYMFGALATDSNMQALFLMIVVGGFVALLTKSGGAIAFTDMVTKKVNSRAKCETGIWLGGIFVWFTDTGNSLIVGPIFESLAQKLRVSREKMAYILDCTTSPICSMIPIIGWGVYTMSLIETELVNGGMTDVAAIDVFMGSVPFNFYAILTLFMAGLVSVTQWDYGSMLQAQNRSLKTGETIRPGGVPMRQDNNAGEGIPEGIEPKISTMVVPLATMLIVLFAYLTSKGLWTTKVEGTDIRTGIVSGFFCATIVLMILCAKFKIFSFSKSLKIFTNGCSNSMFMCIVLVLAWTLSGITGTMDTAHYLVELTKNFLNPALLPCILFILGAVMSFTTGTSWGTMAILMPIGVPMAMSFEVSLPLLSAAIIGGGLYGDHCSPISDTTILASIGSACDHIDHFRTQLPYASTVAIICAIMFLITGWVNSTVMIFVAAIILTVTVFILHKISVKKYGRVTAPDEGTV